MCVVSYDIWYAVEVFSFVVDMTNWLSLFALFCVKGGFVGLSMLLSMLVCVFGVIFRR